MKKNKKLLCIAVVVLLIVAAVLLGPRIRTQFQKTTYLSSSELENIVNTSRISTVRFVHNGIADIKNAKGKVKYHVYYESTATVSANLEDVKYSVDEESRAIIVSLPKLELDKPVIDEKSLEFMPENADYSMKTVLKECKADAKAELESNESVYDTAEENLKETIRALLLPVLHEMEYEIVWETGNGGATYES
ncbi:MAG: DUF4230 domain-containing protein [Anaerovoracaceae bacterium]